MNLNPLDALGRAWRAPGAVVGAGTRALDDLHRLAVRARQDPDPVDEVRERADALLLEASLLIDQASRLVPAAIGIERSAAELVTLTRALSVIAAEIVDGGAELTAVGRSLDEHTVALLSGGADLTAVGRQIEASLLVFRRALPRVLEGIDTVEELEQTAESMADSVEPIAGVAERVGRVTDRLSRRKAS
jgi:hypothetical protein